MVVWCFVVPENNMIDFKTFLIEAEEEQKGKALKHLTHVEDHIIHNGNEGVAIADQHLNDVHNMLLGKNTSSHASVKFDGAPSIVFGQHPQTGHFFVATKSAFNKNPKINYSDEDIEKNHGHAPGLVEKLKHALHHLPGIMPKNGGVYQGDIMHTTGDVTKKNGMHNVTPNTITYSAPADSVEGRNMKKKLGIVVHTQYTGGKSLESMNAGPLHNSVRSKFREHPDVNNIDPTVEVNPNNYTPEEQKQFLTHMNQAKKSYATMSPEALDSLKGHEKMLESHINNMIRTEGKPSVDGYMQDITNKHKKDVDSVKTQAAKDKKAQAHAANIKHVMDNQDHFKRALDLHNHLQSAKNVLVNVMAKNSPYYHSVGGQHTGPEGTVVVDKNGNASKMNNRQEFNRLNFLKGQFQKQQDQDA